MALANARTTMLLAALLAALMLPLAAGAQWEATERLRAAAAEALGSESARVAVDPNTRVPRCRQQPSGHVRARSRSGASIEISCARPAWRLYVPARVAGRAEVAVLVQPVAAGATLRAADIRLEARDTATLGYGWIDEPDDLVGRRIRRSLPAGHPLSPGDLEQSRLVATGDTVTIVSRTHGIEVRMQGRALSHGGRDEQISVRNMQSGRTVDAVVVATGTVEVSP